MQTQTSSFQQSPSKQHQQSLASQQIGLKTEPSSSTMRSTTHGKLERGGSVFLNTTQSSLIWTERIKIKEKSIENLKTYNRNGFPSIKDIIQQPHENLEIQQIAKKSIEEKLLLNDQNDIDFYKIPHYDRKRAKQRNSTNFRTQHQISDKALLGETKLFSESKLSLYEKQVRSTIKKEDPQRQLLLSEIYKKLEDPLDDNGEGTSNSLNDRNQQQNDVKLVENLDNWIRNQKIILKEKEKAKLNLQNKAISGTGGMQGQSSQQPRETAFMRKETIKRMSVTLPSIQRNSNSVMNTTSTEPQKFPQLVGMLRSETRKFTATLNTNVTVNTEVAPSDVLENMKTLSAPENENNNNSNNQTKIRFFDALQEAVKTIHENEREKTNETSSMAMFDNQDRGLRKSIKNYMKKVPDVSDQYSKMKGEQVTNQEFTHEGMRETINDLFKIDDEEGVIGIIDQARYFEKQAGLIETQLILKLRDTVQLINNKVNTARLLRLENYQLLRKVNQLKVLLKQLGEELIDQQNKASKGQKYDAQAFFDNSFSASQVLNNGSGSGSQQQDRKKKHSQLETSGILASGTPSPQPAITGTRQNLIDNLMNNVQKVNDLENEINTIKKTQMSQEQKIKDNDKQIIAIEEGINSKKKELKALSKGKKLFLLELLKNGKDARSEGLTWIIRSIWNGQEKVFDSYLPDFLDQKAKEYLLMRSQKEEELQNMISLLNMQLELYKANIMIKDHMKGIEGLQLDENNQIQEQIKPPNTLNSPGSSQSSNDNQSIMFQQPSGNLVPNLSKIDVKKIKQEESTMKKYQRQENIKELIAGVDETQQNIIHKTLSELNTTKQTSNDIIYNQTQRKIKEVVRQARQQQLDSQLMKDKEKNDFDNSTLLNANQSIISSGENKLPLNNNNNSISITNNNNNNSNSKPVIQDNDDIINKYESREEFVKQYEQLCNKIEDKNKQIKIMEEEELMRIIREFDYKNYRKRMGVPCSTVLCALFGCYKADKELIRHGMTRK